MKIEKLEPVNPICDYCKISQAVYVLKFDSGLKIYLCETGVRDIIKKLKGVQ